MLNKIKIHYTTLQITNKVTENVKKDVESFFFEGSNGLIFDSDLLLNIHFFVYECEKTVERECYDE